MYSATGEGDKLSSLASAQPCRRFSLAELQSATEDFDDELVIGEGGFGKVYKGYICSKEISCVVAIKRLDSMSKQGATEFRAEIEMLSKLRHCHLVSLIGYCEDKKEMILVYEYMPHGTLYHHLHEADTPLNWVQRLKIAIGAARGFDYLHTGVGTQHGIIHRDVKSSNILLDDDWAAMISDFGLSITGPTNQPSSYVNVSVKGTFGYLDPEYLLTGRLTRKTDVFAFGVVLFELLSGRLAVEKHFGEDQRSLARWAKKCVKERKLDQMVDSSIRGTIFPKCLKQFAKIADRCLHSCPKQRPFMAEVVVSLQLLLALQEKCDNPVESSGIMGFPWKMHKYFASSTKGNSDSSGTSSPKTTREDNMNLCSSSIDKDGSDHDETPHQCGEIASGDLKKFTYNELERAARGFNTCLDVGSYEKVYKGWVDETTYSPTEHSTGLPIAIKGLDYYECGSLEKAELDSKLLRDFSHPNHVKLIGYCLNGEELLLVYQFMQNGSLEDYLRNGVVARLPLVTKVKIVIGIARGIVFLHKRQDELNAHLPWSEKVKSRLAKHCIFLDEDFTPKISEYDITKFVDGHYTSVEDDDCYYTHTSVEDDDFYYTPAFWAYEQRINLLGFTAIFTEVLTGKQFSNINELWKMNDLLLRREMINYPQSLYPMAQLCLKICNEVDSESRMLTVLNNFHKYVPERSNEEFARTTIEQCS